MNPSRSAHCVAAPFHGDVPDGHHAPHQVGVRGEPRRGSAAVFFFVFFPAEIGGTRSARPAPRRARMSGTSAWSTWATCAKDEPPQRPRVGLRARVRNTNVLGVRIDVGQKRKRSFQFSVALRVAGHAVRGALVGFNVAGYVYLLLTCRA